jgi:hypothetical protein
LRSWHSPLTACKHTVSGTLSLGFRRTFHLSLTVLVHYRSPGVFSLAGWSPRLPTEFHVFRGTNELRSKASPLSPTGLSPSVAALSRDLRLAAGLVTSMSSGRMTCGSYNPHIATAAACHAIQVSTVPFSLATTKGMVSFPRPTKMFQFGRCPLPGLCVQPGVPGDWSRRVAPFGNPRINVCTQLPEAYRRVLRPSSAPGAKASTVRSL